MKQTEFFVSHNDQQVGPFSVETIVKKVRAGGLNPLDYVYDETRSDWVSMMEHPLFAEQIKDAKPKRPPAPKGAPKEPRDQEEDKALAEAQKKHPGNEGDHLITEWYVLKGENRFGPFAFTDVVKMLQQKVIFEFDFTWHPGMEKWERIAEVESFKDENIQKLKQTLMPEIEEVFFRRRHRRVNYNGTILVHDNNTVWKGQGVEVSAGGAGVVMENAMVVPGQMLYLHFKPCDGVPPFNAVCEVVSKKYVDGVTERNSPVRYGLKFTNLSENTQKFLEEYSKQGEEAA